jgi:hypothetical protein
VSRMSLRKLKRGAGNVTLCVIRNLTDFLKLDLNIIAAPLECDSDYSTVATAYKVQRDGSESWKIHYMDFVDEFRRSLNPMLIILPPPRSFDAKLKALLASLVRYLCNEIEMPCPRWACKRYYLASPWFPSGVESLKASAIVESPIEFRSNNIYVHNNFTARV